MTPTLPILRRRPTTRRALHDLGATPSPRAAAAVWLVATALLCAADGPSFSQPWGLLIPIICVVRRPHEIGGWLLFFHISNFTSLLGSLVFAAVDHSGWSADAWGNDTFLYGVFLFQMVPAFALMAVVLVLAEILRHTRNSDWLVPLRLALWIHFAHAVACVVLDFLFFEFQATMILDIVAVFSTFAWAMYFLFSKRVQKVYITKDWPAPPDPKAKKPA